MHFYPFSNAHTDERKKSYESTVQIEHALKGNHTAVDSGQLDNWDKIQLSEFVFCIIVNAKTVIGSVAIAVLFFFGIVFALASVYAPTRLIVATMLFVVGFGIAYYISRKPQTIVQRLELSGQMKAVSLKCPNCSASIDAGRIKILSGVPYATCTYCGHTFEITEEPKW